MIDLCVMLLALTTGCLPLWVHIVRAMRPTVRAHPQLQQMLASIKTVAIMPPGVTVYQGAFGTWVRREEEAAAARAAVAMAIAQEVGHDASVVFTPFPAPSVDLEASREPAAARLAAELEDTQALFEAVNASVLLHAYPEKPENFAYSLGPAVQQFARLAKADDLLFTSGVDRKLSGGGKAFGAAAALLALTVEGPRVPSIGDWLTRVSVALVDATTGALLWYDVAGSRGAHTLTDPDSAADLTAEVLKDFPLGTRPPRKEHDRSDPSRIGGMN